MFFDPFEVATVDFNGGVKIVHDGIGNGWSKPYSWAGSSSLDPTCKIGEHSFKKKSQDKQKFFIWFTRQFVARSGIYIIQNTMVVVGSWPLGKRIKMKIKGENEKGVRNNPSKFIKNEVKGDSVRVACFDDFLLTCCCFSSRYNWFLVRHTRYSPSSRFSLICSRSLG